jgi:hypothetical protein
LTIDVIVPSVRPDTIDRLLYSFRWNSIWPDLITIVSNEIDNDIHGHGLPVRLIRFRSSVYPVGNRDVALRRNIGIWQLPCSHIVTFDDDQLAPIHLVEHARALLRIKPFFWGHHRYLDFPRYGLEEIFQLPAGAGRPRESPPNTWHLWMSAYAGLFGAEAAYVRDRGGFDLIYCGRHAGEDQDLGRRLAAHAGDGERVFVHEPPFAWHPEHTAPWSAPRYSNLCEAGHALRSADVDGHAVRQCALCPYFEADFDHLTGTEAVLLFDPAGVEMVVNDFNK